MRPETQQRVHLRDGVLVVSPEDAVWQVALLSGLEGGVVTADSALHRRPGLQEQLRAIAGETWTQPRSRTARFALRLARAEAESPGESLTRMACFRHCIPEPQLQHNVFDVSGRFLGRTDFWWEACRHLGEFDGKIKYGRLLKQGESSTDAVVSEKRREDAMRSTLHEVSRFAWHEVQPGETSRRMARLAYELEQSRRLYVSAASGASHPPAGR